jgi:thioredoxin reductase (NADPH)
VSVYDAAIIGAGPAGIAAGVQLQRYGLDFVLFERGEVGGLLHNANLVENYPGFPQGIAGPALVKRMQAQLRIAGVQALRVEVTEVVYEAGVFLFRTKDMEYMAQALVIASGTIPRRFTEIEVPASLQCQVFYEVHALTRLKGNRIAIIGAGDAAFDYAMNLARHNQVAILNRGEKINCLPLLMHRVAQSPNIAYYTDTRLLSLEAAGPGVMRLQCSMPGGRKQLEVDYLIGALGRDPQRDFIPPEFEADARNLEKQGLLYWIGDVQNGRYRQTSIAVGDGVRAAMQIYQRLKEDTR